MEGNKAQFEDGLGKKLFEIDAGTKPALAPLVKDKKTGDTLFELRLDRYEHSLRHVGTYLLMKELTKEVVWEVLESGRAFVVFDWLADATGFDFAVHSGGDRHEMGSRLAFNKDLRFRAQAFLTADWKLIRNGKVVTESTGPILGAEVTGSGNYRVEAWLTVAGEKTIWILSNPIYIRPD